MKTDTPKASEVAFHARVTYGPAESAELVVPIYIAQKLERQRDELMDALEDLYRDYEAWESSGIDAPNWKAKETEAGKKALEAIAAVKGGE